MLQATRRRGAVWPWWIVVGLVHAAMFGPVAFRADYRPGEFVGPNLFPTHTLFSEFAFADWWRPATPGYLWYFVARTLTVLSGSTDPRLGAVVATCIFYALFGIAVFEVYRRVVGPIPPLTHIQAAGASVVIALLESPAVFRGWDAFANGQVFLPLYLPFAPTTIGSLGLNVLLTLHLSLLLDGRLPRGSRWRIAVLVVLATIAKPTMVPLTVAVMLGYAAISLFRRRPQLGLAEGPAGRVTWPTILGLVAAPAVGVVVLQYLATATKVQFPGTGFDNRGGWRLHPLAELREVGALSLVFWMSLIFPIVAFVVARRQMWRDTAVRVCALAAITGIAASLILERSGSIWKGDVLQLPEAAIGLLMVFIPRRVLELDRDHRIGRWQLVVLGLAFAPYLVAGTMSWTCHVGLGCPTG